MGIKIIKPYPPYRHNFAAWMLPPCLKKFNDFICWPQFFITDSVINEYVCERSTLHLDCGPGQTISIISALYGRITSLICENGKTSTTSCESANSHEVVQRHCHGNQTCDIEASNVEFGGDPCITYNKYLHVYYTCIGKWQTFIQKVNKLHKPAQKNKNRTNKPTNQPVF